ncbi:MAG: PHP domain-containing protein [Propionivibrio sp.]
MNSKRRFDSHVHTAYSPDGKDPMAAFAALVDQGVADGIGFAEHYDFLPICGAWEYLDEARYLAEVADWCARGYAFFAGVEVNYVHKVEGDIRRKLRQFPFDFVIGSIHTLDPWTISDREIEHFYDDAIFERILTEYAAEFTASLAMPELDVIGHPGVFQRHLDERFFVGKPWKARIRELEDDLAARSARAGKLIEVNTSGLFCVSQQSCATPFFLERYRAHGGRDISLASDSHAAAHLRRGFAEVAPQLRSLGFAEVYVPWDREQPIPLNEYV